MIKKIRRLITNISQGKISFSTKFSILVYGLLLLTAIVTMVVGLRSAKTAFKKHYFSQLQETGQLKHREISLRTNMLLSEMSSVAQSEEISEIAQGFIQSFFDYKNENPDLFSSEIIEQYKTILKEYYSFELLEQFAVDPPDIQTLIPLDEYGLIFQFRYQVENPRRLSEKKLLIDNGDGSSYNHQHVMYHTQMLNYIKKWNAQDIYLVDALSGSVVYNASKNIAFATDLYQGNYRNSGLARTFKNVNASSSRSFIHFEDFSDYLPDYNRTTAFFGFPVYQNGKKIAALIIELPSPYFTAMIQSNVSEKDGGLSFNLVAGDKILRNNPVEFLEDFERLKEHLSKSSKDSNYIKSIGVYKSMVAKVPYCDRMDNLLQEIPVDGLVTNFTGHKTMLYVKPIDIVGQKWYLITSKYTYMINMELAYMVRWLLVVFIGLTFFAIFGVRRFRKSFSLRLSGLKHSMDILSKGESSKEIAVDVLDEIGQIIDSYNQLSNRIVSASEFAMELSQGNYQIIFNGASEKDILANSLNTLKEKLQKNQSEEEIRKNEDQIRLWVNDGIARFNDILRQSNDDIKLLSDLVIQNLVNYVNANIGGIFLIEGEPDEDKTINLVSAFAYDRKKHLERQYQVNEGLLGNCYHEKKPIYIKDIPEDYIMLRSGLGQAQPRSLYIFPLMVDSNVMGMIEIASIETFEEYKLDFLQRVAENIAATFKTVRLNSQTADLLEVSKRRANEISQQEEEMRQNLEEMQATQEELARLRSEDEKRVVEMQAKIEGHNKMFKGLLNGIMGEVVIKDEQGIIIYANREFAHNINMHLDEVLGRPMSELLEPEQARKDIATDEEVKHAGELDWIEIETMKGEEKQYRVQKRKFYVDTHQSKGILYIRCQVK